MKCKLRRCGAKLGRTSRRIQARRSLTQREQTQAFQTTVDQWIWPNTTERTLSQDSLSSRLEQLAFLEIIRNQSAQFKRAYESDSQLERFKQGRVAEPGVESESSNGALYPDEEQL